MLSKRKALEAIAETFRIDPAILLIASAPRNRAISPEDEAAYRKDMQLANRCVYWEADFTATIQTPRFGPYPIA